MLDRKFIAHSSYEVSNTLVLDKMGFNNEKPENVKDHLSFDFNNVKDGDIAVYIGTNREGKKDIVIHTATWDATKQKWISKNGYLEEQEFDKREDIDATYLKSAMPKDADKTFAADMVGYFTPVGDTQVNLNTKNGEATEEQVNNSTQIK